MYKTKFIALTVVSSVASLMLIVDGIFSRLAADNLSTERSPEQVVDIAFWPLWLPLLLVQVVVLALTYRGRANDFQRNVIYFGVLFFITASMYSLLGHETLKAQLHL